MISSADSLVQSVMLLINLDRPRHKPRPSIVALVGDDQAYATGWIVDITLESWDDVDVKVGDGLAGGLTGVETDVVSVRVQLIVELFLDLIDQVQDGYLFVSGCLEPVPDMSSGDHQGMAGAHRKGIPEGKGQIVFRNDRRALDGAHEAGHCLTIAGLEEVWRREGNRPPIFRIYREAVPVNPPSAEPLTGNVAAPALLHPAGQ